MPDFVLEHPIWTAILIVGFATYLFNELVLKRFGVREITPEILEAAVPVYALQPGDEWTRASRGVEVDGLDFRIVELGHDAEGGVDSVVWVPPCGPASGMTFVNETVVEIGTVAGVYLARTGKWIARLRARVDADEPLSLHLEIHAGMRVVDSVQISDIRSTTWLNSGEGPWVRVESLEILRIGD